ncbi:Leu/Ile/Val-binding protein family signature [Acididesulfobacillus acetoxydans]|uniref:Leu/Ile/Val-binding protein family signature n=1 Tax=Acididesulfobacillus acetoxydans TaxID=1561005 RepID=A0A8S0XVU6_9FIRM|nr:ABC transporter substrate-binding protein [Acididesulfobacillus acetoxydans]CAA7600607.1 Leu/Ile/Val-binding protein family signature [Acididesulfobacillus acetoxydans]CEJ09388.1 Leu/Ile/Val-binding protein homolog 1 [Acididesulfobacillus acetoxydans]
MLKVHTKRSAATVIAVITALGLILGGCGSGGNSPASSSSAGGKLDIGWVAPLTGSSANDGQQMLNGAKLAAKEINDAGGINGKKINIVAQDDKADPKEAANIANMFAGNKHLVAVLGNYNSSCGLAGAPVYDQAKLPMIHVGTSPVFSQQNHPYVFRISVTDAFQGSFVTQWMFDEGHKNVAIIYENDDYGRGLKDTVSSEIQKLGGKVAGTWSYMLGQTRDYTGILTDVKNSGADAIFIGGLYTEGALIGKQMQGLGIKLPVYGTDGLYEESLIKLGGSAVNGWKVSGLFLPTENDPKLQKFIKSYQEAYHSTPGTYAALDFDAMNLLAKVIKTVGTDREKIQAYLAKMPEPFGGVTGNIVFNEHHDAVRKTLKKLVVKDSKWQLFQQ